MPYSKTRDVGGEEQHAKCVPLQSKVRWISQRFFVNWAHAKIIPARSQADV